MPFSRVFRLTTLIALMGLAGALLHAAETLTPVKMDPLRTQTMGVLEDIERTRMLLGGTMWLVHDLRNFALYHGETTDRLEAYDRENLRWYEAIKPIDFAASSLLMAIDLGDDRTAANDLAFIRGEVAYIAPQVASHYRKIAAEHAATKARLTEEARKAGLQVKMIPGTPWDDPLRERQRQLGLQIGWRTNMEPPRYFREAYWNALQKLDINYQLGKGKRIGVTTLTFKDPVLRWDLIEPRKGVYTFTAFDRMMKTAIDQGYRVRLVLPTMGGRVPDWLVKERPESVIRNEKGEADYAINGGVYAHDFMGPIARNGSWYDSRPANLDDAATRALFANYVQAIADHCRKSGFTDKIIDVGVDLFHAQRSWRVPKGENEREYIRAYYQHVTDIVGTAFAPIPMDLEVTDGEAHGINWDNTAHEWRSLGLTELVGIPAVDSETPFYEDLMRAVAQQAAETRTGKAVEAGPFFYQNCEYGFGCMLSVNYFTALLRDGLWSEGWFGPEGILRWGYFPQIFTYNDRQLQWSAITNSYLAHRQAHLLAPTLANTRVTPADVLLLCPSSSMDVQGYHTARELIGWGWALTALKVPYDVITEAALAKGVPTRAKLLILPQAAVLNEAQAQAVRAFVQNGGLLLASTVPGTAGSTDSPLAEVLGCDVLRKDGAPVLVTQTGIKGTWLQVTSPRGLHSGKYSQIFTPDTQYPRPKHGNRQDDQAQGYQALSVRDGTVRHFYGSGEPAIIAHTFGKGRTLTLGYPYGHELVYADWTSIAFGKIYNGWARDEQMLAMVRWLRDTLDDLGYTRITSVPEGWRYRLQLFEAAVSSLAYPKGPAPVDGDRAASWGKVYTYLDARPDHRIPLDHDELDYAMELTWRDRRGVATRYLAVANRESAYAGERAAVQFWLMPHVVRIRLDDPAIRQVYDVAAGAPVALQRDAKGVSFLTSVPPAEGRVFAVSTTDTVELFDGAAFPGVGFDTLAAEVTKLGATGKAPATRVLDDEDVFEWLEAQRNSKVTICYGDDAYRLAADRLVKWLWERYHITAVPTGDDGKFEMTGNENFQITYTPNQAEILIGNAWSNNTIAGIDATWPYNNQQCQAAPYARLTATYAWPGDDRGIVTLTRALDLRQKNGTAFSQGYGNLNDYAPRSVNTAPQGSMRQRLLVLASTPQGAVNAVKKLTE